MLFGDASTETFLTHAATALIAFATGGGLLKLVSGWQEARNSGRKQDADLWRGERDGFLQRITSLETLVEALHKDHARCLLENGELRGKMAFIEGKLSVTLAPPAPGTAS